MFSFMAEQILQYKGKTVSPDKFYNIKAETI